MLTKTSREVLSHAMQLARVNNLGFVDFFNAQELLNNEYRKIYEKIATADDGYYDCEFTFSGDSVCLPDDVWVVKRVVAMFGDQEGDDILRSAGQTVTPGQYSIRAGVLYMNTSRSADYKVIYAPRPATLTVPDTLELLPIEDTNVNRYISLTDDEFTYEDTDGAVHKFDLNKQLDSIVPGVAPAPQTEYKYCGGLLKNTDGAWTWTDSRGNEYDAMEDLLQDNTSGLKNVQVSDPYLAVTYNDDTMKVFNGWCAADYNIFAYKGRNTYGELKLICTNDFTGRGVIYYNTSDNKLYYASFVPDTVLNYPDQADFSLLELELAEKLAQMAGTSSSWITDSLKDAREEFAGQLKRLRGSSMRVNNVRAGMNYIRR